MPLSNLTHDHKSVGAWRNRGLVRKKLDDFIGAMRDFTEVLWLQLTSAGASRQQNQPAPINLSQQEYAAALAAGFEPETGEQLFYRPHIQELIEEYQEAEGRQKESLLYLIGAEGGVITAEDTEEIYMQVTPKLLERHCRKVKHFIAQQLQTPIDPCPEVYCELHGLIAIFIHKRVELGKVRYGYSLRHSEWLIPDSNPWEPFTEPGLEGNADFERVLANARGAVLDHNRRFIHSELHEHVLFGDYCPEVAGGIASR